MRRFLLLCGSVMLSGLPSAADEILLRNGNLIHGQVVSEDGGTFVVEVDAGRATVEMTIPRESVRTVRRAGQQRVESVATPVVSDAELAAPQAGDPAETPAPGGGLLPPLTTLDEPDFTDDDFIGKAEAEIVRLEALLEQGKKEYARESVVRAQAIRDAMIRGEITPEEAQWRLKNTISQRIDPAVERPKGAIQDVKEAIAEWQNYRSQDWRESEGLVPELAETPGEAGPASGFTLVNEAAKPAKLELSPMGENGADPIITTVEPGASGQVAVPNRKRYLVTVRLQEGDSFLGRLTYCRGGVWVEAGTDYVLTTRPEAEE